MAMSKLAKGDESVGKVVISLNFQQYTKKLRCKENINQNIGTFGSMEIV